MNKAMIPLSLRRAVDLGWQPVRPKELKSYPCAAGCGRTFTAAAEDEVHGGLRMVGYLCLDCRKGMANFLRARRAGFDGQPAALARRMDDGPAGSQTPQVTVKSNGGNHGEE